MNILEIQKISSPRRLLGRHFGSRLAVAAGSRAGPRRPGETLGILLRAVDGATIGMRGERGLERGGAALAAPGPNKKEGGPQ